MPLASFTPTNDEPSLELLPERQALLEQLADGILNIQPPHVFGVHGTWGAGKTSFLHRLQFTLTGDCAHNGDSKAFTAAASVDDRKKWDYAPVCIWFEAWRYQHEVNPVIALLHEMRAQFGRIVTAVNQLRRLGTGAKSSIMTLLKDAPGIVASAVKAGFSVLGAGPALDAVCNSALEAFENVGEKVANAAASFKEGMEKHDQETFRQPLQTYQLREQLDTAVGQLLGGLFPRQKPAKEQSICRARRVIVFVDDLDRCEPKTAYRLLEGIKIYLSLQNCVFVLGVNREELVNIIAEELPGREETAHLRAQEYLEKLCGHCVTLPDCSRSAQAALVQRFLKIDDAQLVSSIAEFAQSPGFLPANPRRIKAFCNTAMRIYHKRVRKTGPEGIELRPSQEEARALALVASLEQFHPDLFVCIRRYPGFLSQLRTYSTQPAKDEGGDLHAALKMLKLPERIPVSPDSSPTPGSQAQRIQSFADTASLGVFHAQSLLLSDHFGNDEIAEDLFRAYLD